VTCEFTAIPKITVVATESFLAVYEQVKTELQNMRRWIHSSRCQQSMRMGLNWQRGWDFFTYWLSVLLPRIGNIGGMKYVHAYIFTCKSSYCFQRVLAIAILSVGLSVCLSVRHTVKNGAS